MATKTKGKSTVKFYDPRGKKPVYVPESEVETRYKYNKRTKRYTKFLTAKHDGHTLWKIAPKQ